MESIKALEHNDNTPDFVEVEEGSFDSIAGIFDSEKGGNTIEKELDEFSSASSTEKDEINSTIEEENGFNLDDLGSSEDEDSDSSEGQEEVVQEDELEDYFESAEFIIFIIELAIVWGTNYYLKSKNLDKITKDELEVTARQHKSLVKSWAKVLRKHKAKVSPEVELLFNMGASYGIKIQAIVKKQEDRKKREIQEARQGKKMQVVQPRQGKSKKVPDKQTREAVIKGEKIVEEEEEEVKGFRLDKSKKIEQDPTVLI